MLDLLGTRSAPDHRTLILPAPAPFFFDPVAATFATPNHPPRVRTILPIPPQIRCYKAAGDKITKRGPGVCRYYLYLAALRLIQDDPVVRAWYGKKVARDGGRMKNKAVIAVVRKLVKGLWHVARGEPFDSRLLFDTSKLDLLKA